MPRGFAVAGVFFARFYRDTRDRLFGFLAVSYTLLAVNRLALGLDVTGQERGDYYYWIRFAAFALILWAIVDKNRGTGERL